MKEFIRGNSLKIAIALLFALLLEISYFTKVGCVWKLVFGIPCPGCGYIRAIFAVMRFDFAAAFEYHPMVWSFPFLVFYFLFGDRIKCRPLDVFMVLTVVGFLVLWFIRVIVPLI